MNFKTYRHFKKSFENLLLEEIEPDIASNVTEVAIEGIEIDKPMLEELALKRELTGDVSM